MQKNATWNDLSNTTLTTWVDIVVRKLWYSKYKLNEQLFEQCIRIKHKFAIKIVTISWRYNTKQE